MPTAAEIVVGIALPLFGGLCNASWNLPGKEAAPSFCRAVQSANGEWGWAWEQFWFVQQLASMIFNTVLLIGMLSYDTVIQSYENAAPRVGLLVCLFSFTWGFGTIGFGLAIKVVGVGLGTALTMSVIVIMGVVYPVAFDGGFPSTQAAVLIVVGVSIGIAGFGLLGRAVFLRDQGREVRMKDAGTYSSRKELELVHGVAFGRDEMAPVYIPSQSPVFLVPDEEPCALPAEKDDGNVDHPKVSDQGSEVDKSGSGSSQPPAIQAAVLCAIAGCFASTLQLAFITGEDVLEEAELLGVSKLISGDLVWIVAFPVSGLVNLVYSMYLMAQSGSWKRFDLSKEGEIWRWVLCSGSAVLFVAHIHIYGTAAALLGDLGPVIAWPVLMCSTMLFGQIWGMFLQEFVPGDDGRTLNYVATGLACVAIVVTSCAGI